VCIFLTLVEFYNFVDEPTWVCTADPFSNYSNLSVARLRQHSTGSTEFSATLAYRLAKEKVPHEKTRREAMQDPAFRAAFNEAQILLRGCTVAFIEIPNPLELYLFEAYCAMALDTCEWNTFRTH